jgi:hypothetical protein
MKDTVICYVEKKNGKWQKFKSKGGKPFKGPDGKDYNAPVKSNKEIRDYNHPLLGRRQEAFYAEGIPQPIPLGHKLKWDTRKNHDSDKDILVEVMKRALRESTNAELKQNITLGAIGLVFLFLFVERLVF